jgi:putative peptide zinc metalloprotease protein
MSGTEAMPQFAPTLPACRPDLIVRTLGHRAACVLKDPRTGAYFQVGEQESFLLSQLDGRRRADAVCDAFRERFGEALSAEDLEQFLRLAYARGFLQPIASAGEVLEARAAQTRQATDELGPSPVSAPAPTTSPRRQSILYWRKSFFDPDRLFNRLAPRLWFFWTPGFLLLSAVGIVAAAVLVWAGRDELIGSFVYALRWETVFLVWLTVMAVTTLHEFAHGLTCKHFGGEVHEIGFLLLFFMPCFYCNVSDAWLFREKSKRLWVTFAGGYFELCLWALAVFVWRLTPQADLVNYLASVVLSVCAVRTLFNMNPLLKLDGYYVLSDWLEVPNLQPRALAHFKAHLRNLLWGAPRPAAVERGRLLFRFGLATWLYSMAFLALMLTAIFQYSGTRWGLFGIVGTALLGLTAVRGICSGISAGEVRQMILLRHKRTAGWLLSLGGLAAVLVFVEMEDRAGGTFRLRPTVRAELRAPVAGFLEEVYCNEGDRVSPGAAVARLEIPDLASRLAQKQAEMREARARVRLLEVGARPEEVEEQRSRVARATSWRDLGQEDLQRNRHALDKDLVRLEKQAAACRAELDAAQDVYKRAGQLRGGGAVTEEQYREAERKMRVCAAHVEQTEAEKGALQAKGTLVAEAELARRERELADARAALALMEAGPRSEELEAERARLARLQEEERYLEQIQGKLLVQCPVPGLIATARPKEKVGQYVREGEVLWVVEEPAGLEVEIALAEHEAARVRAGQTALLRIGAFAFETFPARVDRIAPTVKKEDVPAGSLSESPTILTVYCRLDTAGDELRPGMSGYARIYTGRRPIGAIVLERAARLLRPEFWWW